MSRNRALTCALNHRPIRNRVTEWDAKLNYVRTRIDSGYRNPFRNLNIRIADREIHHETGLACKMDRHPRYSSHFNSRARMPRSLSPRPDRFTSNISLRDMPGAIRIASATAWADSSAG